MSEGQVVDTLAEMTAASLARFEASADTLMLIRIAALVAVDAPEISYLANFGPSTEAGLTIEDVQNVLVAVAPIVGAPKVMSAAAKIADVLGLVVAVAEAELDAELEAELDSED